MTPRNRRRRCSRCSPILRRMAAHAVKRIDTHAASVFLAGERALKVKRAVRFPFLDYSTLAKRKAACETELAINRRTAPGIYRARGRRSRARRTDGCALDGRGEPVEWAVEMRRFDENADARPSRRRRERSTLRSPTRSAAPSRRRTPMQRPPMPRAGSRALESYIDEHVEAFGEQPDLFPPDANRAFADAGRAAFARLRPLLAERGRTGFIRRIHGDLHLGNIVLLDDRPVLFDAIEFSEVIASGDVLYDLAFLLMDLVERDLRAAANIVFNRYLVESGARREPRRARRAAVLPVDAGGDPRQGDRGAARARRSRTSNRRSRAAPAPISTGRAASSRRRRRSWSRSAGCPAPASRCWRARSRRRSRRRRARSCCAPTSSARHLFGKDELEPLPPEAYTPEVTARVYAAIVDEGAPRRRRRPFRDPRRGVRAARRARAGRTRGGGHRRAFSGAVPRGRRGDARPARRQRASATPPTPMPTWRARRRRYDLGALDLASRRCFGNAGRDACSAPKRRWHERRRARPIDKLARGTAVGARRLSAPSSISIRRRRCCRRWRRNSPSAPPSISATMTAGTLAVALTAPFSGAVADVIGRKRVITASMAGARDSDPDDRDRAGRAVDDRLALHPGADAAVDLRGHHRLYRRRVAGGGSRRHGRHLHLGREPRRLQRPVRHRHAGRLVGWRSALCGAGADHARGRRRGRRAAAARAPFRAVGKPGRVAPADAAPPAQPAAASPPMRSASARCSISSRPSPTSISCWRRRLTRSRRRCSGRSSSSTCSAPRSRR